MRIPNATPVGTRGDTRGRSVLAGRRYLKRLMHSDGPSARRVNLLNGYASAAGPSLEDLKAWELESLKIWKLEIPGLKDLRDLENWRHEGMGI